MTFTVSPPQHAIELRTLGALDLRTAEGRELRSAMAQGKRMALLTYLAIAQPRGFHRRDTLVGLFWPETDQRRARAALRQALFFLRQALGPDVVQNRGPEEIGIDFTKLNCDVLRFEKHLDEGDCEQAVGLYRGPLLKGFYVPDAPEFEKWLGVERDRLAERYADCLRSLAENASECGDIPAAVRWWRKLAVHDPYSSEIALQLISALDASGDRAGAMAHAQQHTDLVRSDLEVEPDSQIGELVEELKNRPPSRAPRPLVITPNPTETKTLSETPVPNQTRSQVPTSLRWSLTVVAALVIVSGALFAFTRTEAPVRAGVVSLAVLPFDNLGSSDDDYFAAGIAEDIVGRLAGVQALSIVGPSDGGLDAPNEPGAYSDAASNADYLLRGSVERIRANDGSFAVRILPSLSRNPSGTQIWADEFEADISQLFGGEVRIVEEVIRTLGITPLAAERDWLRSRPTENAEAVDLFYLGNQKLKLASGSIDHNREAVGLFERAIAIDPLFVQAHAKLAIAHTSMYWWGHDRSRERLQAARAAADNAVRIRPDIPNSHVALGWYYYWGERDYDRALRHFELARTNWNGLCEVLVLVAAIRRRQGDFERALSDHYEAATANPSCATCYAGAAFTHLMLRDYASSRRDVDDALDIAPGFQYARRVGALSKINSNGDTAGARAMLGPPENDLQLIRMATGQWSSMYRILSGEWGEYEEEMALTAEIVDTSGFYLVKAEHAGRNGQRALATRYYEVAREYLERRTVEAFDDPTTHSRLGIVYAALGMRDEAVAAGTEATRLRPVSDDAVDGAMAIERLAVIYTLLGEHDSALERLEMLLSIPSHLSAETIRLDPVWIPLRQHERFQALLR